MVSSKNGFPWQASIGASVEEFEFVKEHQKVMVNGKEHMGPLNVARKATLGEISFVDLGADGQTQATIAAHANRHRALDVFGRRVDAGRSAPDFSSASSISDIGKSCSSGVRGRGLG